MKTIIVKTFKEPLLHFALLGSMLFILFAWLNPLTTAPKQLVISSQKIQQLAIVFDKKYRRAPNPVELKQLIDDYVLEEIYYREAMAMEMDKNDTVIRRRLRQKMEFLLNDVSQSMTPSDNELQSFLDNHPDAFALDARFSLQQIYVDPSKHSNIDPVIAHISNQLAQGQPVKGDVTMLAKSFDDTPSSRLNAVLGQLFVEQLSALEPNTKQWQGPISSSYGLHWVLLTQSEPSKQPTLQTIYTKVLREWRYDLQLRSTDEINQKLRQKYQLKIQWPQITGA